MDGREGSSESVVDASSLTAHVKVIEVERDRLGEYARVLNQRLSASEERASNAEFGLRDERRKTAKLERMLEQVHVAMRDSSSSTPGTGRDSVLGTPARVVKDQNDEITALIQVHNMR